jgi:hypothetical protein
VNEPPVADERASYLPELAGLLAGPYVVVPSARRPRVLVPDRAGRAAAAALRYSVEAVGSTARLRRTALAAAFRLGVGGLLCRDRVAAGNGSGGIDAHLGEVLGRPVLLGVHIGPSRANRKPVLVLLDTNGGLLGFAKLGVNELTRELVDAEAAALRRLATADLGPVAVPAVLFHGQWGQHALLVQEALPVWRPRATPSMVERAEQAALAAVAECLGVRESPYAGSSYATRLTAAVDGLENPTARVALHGVLAAVAARPDPLRFGSWHGDWSGTNHAVLSDGRVLVWDWERFDTDVPVGFDALHQALQRSITRDGLPPFEAAHALFDEPPAGVDDVVTTLYLVHLGTRYLHDRQAEAGVRLGRVGEWLLPVLQERWS